MALSNGVAQGGTGPLIGASLAPTARVPREAESLVLGVLLHSGSPGSPSFLKGLGGKMQKISPLAP